MRYPHELTRLSQAISSVFRGSQEAVERVLISFLASGHVLIEDIPGVGKTTLAKALAQSLGGSFRRLQCTLDLMPSDVTGVSIYEEREGQFVFHPGPVFCDVLLADEWCRWSAEVRCLFGFKVWDNKNPCCYRCSQGSVPF